MESVTIKWKTIKQRLQEENAVIHKGVRCPKREGLGAMLGNAEPGTRTGNSAPHTENCSSPGGQAASLRVIQGWLLLRVEHTPSSLSIPRIVAKEKK